MDSDIAARMGAEAIRLGWVWRAGMRGVWFDSGGYEMTPRSGHGERPSPASVPDFRDPLTEAASVLWAETVARGVYGEAYLGLKVVRAEDGFSRVTWTTRNGVSEGPVMKSLAGACIAAVYAMKGGE